MDPVAFHLGALTIRWYGVFFALGFLAGYQLVVWRGRRSPVGAERAGDLAVFAIIGGVLGARALYVAQNAAYFMPRPLEMLAIHKGGLVFYGGFIGAALALVGICRWRKIRVGDVGDVFAPALPLAHAFGRIGCLLNGCCFGIPWEGPGAVDYSGNAEVCYSQYRLGWSESATDPALPVFPVQLLDAVLNIVIMAVLLLFERRRPRRGALFPLYLILYTLMRFGVEFLRGDYAGGVGIFTPGQFVCLLLFPVAVVWFVRAQRRCGSEP